jgi:hypothetical protein
MMATGGDQIQAAASGGLVIAVAIVGLRPVRLPELLRWSARFGVRLDVDTAPLVRARIRRSRAWRYCAAAVGLAISVLPAFVNLLDADAAGSFAGPGFGAAALAGAAGGAVLAELLVVQRPSPTRRAELSPRRSSQYVTAGWILLLAAAAAMSVVAVALFLAGVGSSDGSAHDVASVATGGLSSFVAFWAAVAGLRAIARRPRLALEGPLRDVDDTLRIYGGRHLAGAALALGLSGIGLAVGPLLPSHGAGALGRLVLGLGTTWIPLWLWTQLAFGVPVPVSGRRERPNPERVSAASR